MAVDFASEVIAPGIAFYEKAVSCGKQGIPQLWVLHELAHTDFIHQGNLYLIPVRAQREVLSTLFGFCRVMQAENRELLLLFCTAGLLRLESGFIIGVGLPM